MKASSQDFRRARSELVAKKLPTAQIDDRIGDAKDEIEVITMLRQRGITSACSTKARLSTANSVAQRGLPRAKQNPDLLIYKLKSNSYKWSWAIIPLSVPFIWLMFPFSRRFKVYDHIVFVTYSVAFMTLLVAIGALLSAVGLSAVAGLTMLVAPWHMYRQLRGAYGCSGLGALWRTSVLLCVAMVVLSAFIVAMAALGALD